MDSKFTSNDIKKALEQADANIGFEEINIDNIKEVNKPKKLVKEIKYGQTNRSNQMGTISNSGNGYTKK